LGHSSIKMTVDIYGHWIPGANREAVNKLPFLVAGSKLNYHRCGKSGCSKRDVYADGGLVLCEACVRSTLTDWMVRHRELESARTSSNVPVAVAMAACD